jgi:hypothetical protein
MVYRGMKGAYCDVRLPVEAVSGYRTWGMVRGLAKRVISSPTAILLKQHPWLVPENR